MLILLFLLLILILLSAFSFYVWQKKLFSWHCKNVYPFHEKLTPTEQSYIQQCIRLSWCELLRPFFSKRDPILNRLSFFSYSTRVKNGVSSSGRIAYGSGVRPGTAYEYAQAVLKERKIEVELNENLIFGGLGWDFEEKTFRVYLRCKDLSKIDTKKEGEGGIAWTYDEEGKQVDEKIYSFPEKKVTLLDSSRRGGIYQYDESVPKNVPEKVKEVMDFYKKYGYELDTYAKNGEEYTLYFPRIG